MQLGIKTGVTRRLGARQRRQLRRGRDGAVRPHGRRSPPTRRRRPSARSSRGSRQTSHLDRVRGLRVLRLPDRATGLARLDNARTRAGRITTPHVHDGSRAYRQRLHLLHRLGIQPGHGRLARSSSRTRAHDVLVPTLGRAWLCTVDEWQLRTAPFNIHRDRTLRAPGQLGPATSGRPVTTGRWLLPRAGGRSNVATLRTTQRRHADLDAERRQQRGQQQYPSSSGARARPPSRTRRARPTPSAAASRGQADGPLRRPLCKPI